MICARVASLLTCAARARGVRARPPSLRRYVLKALEFQKANGGSTTFIHNNAYKEEELGECFERHADSPPLRAKISLAITPFLPCLAGECFERNAEGMLKNMAIHELALLATYYGVTVDNIESVVPDAEYSRCLTLTGPSGDEFTDFAKASATITSTEEHAPRACPCAHPPDPCPCACAWRGTQVGFTITTKEGKTVTVKADRCGSAEGGDSKAVVSIDGVERFESVTPDEELKKVQGGMRPPTPVHVHGHVHPRVRCVPRTSMRTHARAPSCARHTRAHRWSRRSRPRTPR